MSSRPHCQGFSLLELMIGLGLGLIIIATATALYLGTKQSYNLQRDFRQIQESGRFAIDLIARELRQTGYLGSNLDTATITGTEAPVAATNTCPNNNQWGRMMGLELAGLDDPSVPSSVYACIANAEFLRGDVLTIRYIDPTIVIAVDPSLPSQLYLRAAPFTGRLFAASNAANASNNISDSLATTHRLVSHTYFVGPSGGTCRGAAIPSLFRKTLNAAGVPITEEVIQGIEHLQFRYGFDTDADGIVNQYRDADAIPTVAGWNQVLTVNVWLLARSDCATAEQADSRTFAMGDQSYTPNDRYNRQLFSTTIAIRN